MDLVEVDLGKLAFILYFSVIRCASFSFRFYNCRVLFVSLGLDVCYGLVYTMSLASRTTCQMIPGTIGWT